VWDENFYACSEPLCSVSAVIDQCDKGVGR
jgi:hypothetical protein